MWIYLKNLTKDNRKAMYELTEIHIKKAQKFNLYKVLFTFIRKSIEETSAFLNRLHKAVFLININKIHVNIRSEWPFVE